MSADNRVFQDVKGACSLIDYIEANSNGKMVKSGASVFINPAPCCNHNDCFSIFGKGPDKDGFKCHSCGEKGDVFTFAEKIEGLPRHEALKKVAAFAGVALPDRDRPAHEPQREKSRAEFIAEKCLANPKAGVDWLIEERKILPEVAQRAALCKAFGFNDYVSTAKQPGEKFYGGPAAAFIVRSLNPGHVMAVDLRYFDAELNGGIKTQTQGEKGGYGWTSDVKRLRQAETVYWCESPINALSIECSGLGGRYAAYAIRGVANAENIPMDWCRGKQHIIVPDNDEPGQDGYCAGLKAAWALHERLTAMDCSAMLVDVADWGVNDINDVLKADGPDGVKKALRKLEQWAIPGMWGSSNDLQLFPQGKRRIFLPYHHDNMYWRYRVRPDFTSYIDKVETPTEGDNLVPKLSFRELCGFRVASISRVKIQSATATMTGDADLMPKTLFSVSVQTTRHGANLVRRVLDDEKLHNIDQWKRFGPVWDQSRFLRLVNVLENAAHLGARNAANFVGLCWRDGELVVNEGPDCYFVDPEQQCPYSNLIFPSGQVADAREVLGAFQRTFTGNPALRTLVWALGAHLKAFLGFWPHGRMQAEKETGKSTLLKRLERVIGMTILGTESVKNEFRIRCSVSHTSQPIGWEEISKLPSHVISEAITTLQQTYQYVLVRTNSDQKEFLKSAPVLLAGEDVDSKDIEGKLVRFTVSKKDRGELIPENICRFPMRQWLGFLASLRPERVRELFRECVGLCQRSSRASSVSDSVRMTENYAALLLAWKLLCEFSSMDENQGHFMPDLFKEMNFHFEATSATRHPWVWIMEAIAREATAGHFELWRVDDFDYMGTPMGECLFIRTGDIMHHLKTKIYLRTFWDGLPIKSDRVLKDQLQKAEVVLRNADGSVYEVEKTVRGKRLSRCMVMPLEFLETYGVEFNRPMNEGGE